MNESENTDENSVCILSRLSLLDLHVCLAPKKTYSSVSLWWNEIWFEKYFQKAEMKTHVLSNHGTKLVNNFLTLIALT